METKNPYKIVIFENDHNHKTMDISSEKAEIMKQFEQVRDISLIRAIKNLLDFGLSKQAETDDALEASIKKGLEQSKKGEVRPHEQSYGRDQRAL